MLLSSQPPKNEIVMKRPYKQDALIPRATPGTRPPKLKHT